MNEAETTLVGNVGNVELRFTPSGVAVCKFSVAMTPRVKKDGEWVDGEATWYNCTAWRELGEHVADTIEKGARVIVKGRLSLRQYETREGGKGASLDLEADAVGPELRYATAKVTKAAAGASAGTTGGRDDPWASASKERPAATASAETQRASQDEETPW